MPKSILDVPFVACTYCHTVSNAAGNIVERRDPEEAPPPSDDWERKEWAKKQAWKGFREALTGGDTVTFEQLRDASRDHLSVLGETDALARVAWSLLMDFEREHAVQLSGDPEPYVRIARGYLDTVRALITKPSTELNLPFIHVTDDGPLHLTRELSVESLRELAEREPEPRGGNEGGKRGFWSKLFG